MGAMLTSPVELTRVQRKGSTAFRCAVAEMQGWRNNHEDAHAMLCEDDWGSFWVLDGHGGDGASIFCAPRLLDVVGDNPGDGKLPSDATIDFGFVSVDQEFRSHVNKHAEAESGTTVIGTLVVKHRDGTYSVKVMNCGDSRGLVVCPPTDEESTPNGTSTRRPAHLPEVVKSSPWPLYMHTIDHKPDLPTEKERIEAAGGFVSLDEPARLDGNLAVSRGLGDFEYKVSLGKNASEQKVSCVPDIYEVTGLKEGSCIILACDGLWDVLGCAEVAQYVRSALKADSKADLGVLCAELVKKALEENSRDNVTVMVIQLTDGSEWGAKSDGFNDSDEMMYFDKLLETNMTDEELRKQYYAFLRKCDFPVNPVQCSVTGRWFKSMWRCPETGNVYIHKDCQEQGGDSVGSQVSGL